MDLDWGSTYEVGGDQHTTLELLELCHRSEAVLLLTTAADVCGWPAMRIQCVRQALGPATTNNVQFNVSDTL